MVAFLLFLTALILVVLSCFLLFVHFFCYFQPRVLNFHCSVFSFPASHASLVILSILELIIVMELSMA